MKMEQLKRLERKTGSNLEVRRYHLSDMISESYKSLYDSEEGTNLRRIVESHLDDVRNNPTDLDRLSRQLSIIKELCKLTESGDLKDEDLVDKENYDEVPPKKERVIVKREDENCHEKDLNEADDAELTDEELEELTKHLETIRKERKTAPPKTEMTEEASPRKGIKAKTHETKEVDETCHEEDLDEDTVEEPAYAVIKPDGTYAGVFCTSYEEARELAAQEEGRRIFKLTPEGVEECNDPELPASKTYESLNLSEFGKKSSSKAFMKTFKKMQDKLKEGTALTRQESIALYKAANSAMTHLSVELEHNPEFLDTFKESTSLLSEDVDRLLSSLKEGKAPSKKNMKSLAKFTESLLNEAEEDEESPIEDEEDEFVGDEEGDISSEESEEFDQEYADARVELHKELADEHADSEDPAVQEKIAQDADEVVNLPGITDEQVEEIQGTNTEEEVEETPEGDSNDITDDELEELKKHLKEMRAARK